MAKLKHTRYGWFDKDRAPYLSYGVDAHDRALRLAPLPEDGRCCLPRAVSSLEELPPMTFAECCLLLSNISLGLRATVLHGQNRYIDRWEKTFFREGAPVKLLLSQESVYNLSSLANYVNIRRIDKTRGVIEALYEEYLFICGQLSYSLLEAARRYHSDKEAELGWEIGSRRHNLYTQEIPKATANALAKKMTPQLAMGIVEGAMCSCAIRDRSNTQKDSKNKQLQSILGAYGGIELGMDELIESSSLVGAPLFNHLSSLSQAAPDEFWLMLSGEDSASSSRKWSKSHPRRRYKELS